MGIDEVSLSWSDEQFMGAVESLICCKPDNEGLLMTWTSIVDLIKSDPQMANPTFTSSPNSVLNRAVCQMSPDLNESLHQLSTILSETETPSARQLVRTEAFEETERRNDGQVIGEVRSMDDDSYQLIEYANNHALESTGFTFSKLLLIRIGRYCA